MDFNVDQSLMITKAIIELIDSLRVLGLIQDRPREIKRFEERGMVFYKKDM